jgi:hypothetical protein
MKQRQTPCYLTSNTSKPERKDAIGQSKKALLERKSFILYLSGAHDLYLAPGCAKLFSFSIITCTIQMKMLGLLAHNDPEQAFAASSKKQQPIPAPISTFVMDG